MRLERVDLYLLGVVLVALAIRPPSPGWWRTMVLGGIVWAVGSWVWRVFSRDSH